MITLNAAPTVPLAPDAVTVGDFGFQCSDQGRSEHRNTSKTSNNNLLACSAENVGFDLLNQIFTVFRSESGQQLDAEHTEYKGDRRVGQFRFQSDCLFEELYISTPSNEFGGLNVKCSLVDP